MFLLVANEAMRDSIHIFPLKKKRPKFDDIHMKKLGEFFGFVSLKMWILLCVCGLCQQIILILGLGSVNYKTGKRIGSNHTKECFKEYSDRYMFVNELFPGLYDDFDSSTGISKIRGIC